MQPGEKKSGQTIRDSIDAALASLNNDSNDDRTMALKMIACTFLREFFKSEQIKNLLEKQLGKKIFLKKKF